MRAADKAKPLTTKMALHAILVRIVGQLTKPPEVRRSILQPRHTAGRDSHGLLLGN
jgi:hypothetical protein